ncbi:hypothetical protein L210DRAFT_953146 [Boletus edulis BED1]|uniref:Uncharacterized protein n=1 Tax=Boletus edulis BED1 TaxID=1328754 RepID=A0AAD4G8S5_BOLED|nr:hypothetical protein L210DRAFT_953146 [Boletus edulis BED1]
MHSLSTTPAVTSASTPSITTATTPATSHHLQEYDVTPDCLPQKLVRTVPFKMIQN